MILQLHHVGLLTRDLESMSARLSEVFDIPSAQPRSVRTEGYELRTAMVPIGNGTHLQIIEPSRGAGVRDLAERGDGALFEVAFQVQDVEAAGWQLRRQGLTPVDFAGSDLNDGFATAASGSKYLYLPAGSVMGPRVELIQSR